MSAIPSSLFQDYEPMRLALATAVCLFAFLVSSQMYARARAVAGGSRILWACLMGVVTGFGVWATHTIAITTMHTPVPLSYDPALTITALALALGSGIVASVVLARAETPAWRAAAGAILGLGIGGMQEVSLQAVHGAGTISFNPVLLLLAFAAGVPVAALALVRAGDGGQPIRLVGAALILTGGVMVQHVLGLAAITLRFDPAAPLPEEGLSSEAFTGIVFIGAVFLLSMALLSTVLDRRNRQREEDRLRAFSDVAVEGLVICRDGLIIDANESFCRLAARDLGALRGTAFATLLVAGGRPIEPGVPAEGTLIVTGTTGGVPVSVLARPLTSHGQTRMVYAVRDLTEQREAERRIRFLAHHDALTGLPNRVTFATALETALRQYAGGGPGPVVLCLDLDHFKNINDLFGHLAGDAVLVEATRRMRAVLGEGDLLARLGGDEFAIVSTARPESPRGLWAEGGLSTAPAHDTGPSAFQAATALAQRLIDAMGPDLEIDGNHMVIGLSAGLAFAPSDGTEAERLLANADTALYRAKSEGRGRFRCFEPEMDSQVRERHELSAELRRAIARNELVLYYQPQVRGEIVEASPPEMIGFEALVRWNHPRRGLVGPQDFIDIAEETGQIIALGEWVLRTACIEAARWPRPLKIAVNISAVQFQQTNLPELVHMILLETGLPASRLELEITETAIINDMGRALMMLRRLKALGVRIAMDDFGTGYSSLATLQAFPFDKIKIDRSFVAKLEEQPQAAVIVRAVLGLGRNLGMGVVAEGVETAGQMRFLVDEACDEAQGYLFGRPCPIESFTDVLYGRGLHGQGLGDDDLEDAAVPHEAAPDEGSTPSESEVLSEDGRRSAA